MTGYCEVRGEHFVGVIRPFVITDEQIFRARTKTCPVVVEFGGGA